MTAYAPRVRVNGLIDDFSGTALDHAVLTGDCVRLRFKHLATDAEKTIAVSTAVPLAEMTMTRLVEVVDGDNRCRLLKITPNGSEALQNVVRRLDEAERNQRAARAGKSDVKLYTIARSSSKLGTTVFIEAAPLPNIELRFDPTVYLESAKLTADRLELTVRFGDKRLKAALDNFSKDDLESLSWGAASGRLRWFGLLGELVRPEPVRVVVLDQEQLQTALKAGRQTARSGVLNG